MMCINAEDLRRRAEWDGAKGTSRQKLLVEIQSIFTFLFFSKKYSFFLIFNKFKSLEYISPSIMVPEHRLETLLEQATTLQRISCLYHNTDQYISLYSDHECDRLV